MQKSIFEISKMDCAAEESLIRIKLSEIPAVKNLEFDIPSRHLSVFHSGSADVIESSIASLNLGSKLLETEEVAQTEFAEQTNQRKLLWSVLAINFAFFIVEMTTGLISGSMGLVADSLDMLADSSIYGISLFAVGGTLARKKNIAKIAGYLQITLAVIGFVEIVRRFIGGFEAPDASTMIIVSILALGANIVSLYLLQKSSSDQAHMRASMICTSNDVIINLGVITAGILVYLLNSNKPDLVIGAIVFALVMSGALRILKLGR